MLVGNKVFDAIALDVSEGGMAILANYEIPASTLVTTKFMMVNEHALHDEDRFRSMEIPGEVRYSRPAQDRTYRLGIQFTGITAGQRDFIAHFIKTDPFRRGSDEAGGME
jgi:c-di-GMP-binding flagellar brake protein YcgR